MVAFLRRPGTANGALARISAIVRRVRLTGLSPGWTGPPSGSKNSTRTRGRFGNRTMSTAPVTATQTTRVSGTANTSRPAPLRARSGRPRDTVPSGNTPTQAPAFSRSIAAASAWVSPRPRSIGIWPMWSSTQPSARTFHRDDLASARSSRRGSAATPSTTGSQALSWFASKTVDPDVGMASAPITSRRPHHRTIGEASAITMRYISNDLSWATPASSPIHGTGNATGATITSTVASRELREPLRRDVLPPGRPGREGAQGRGPVPLDRGGRGVRPQAARRLPLRRGGRRGDRPGRGDRPDRGPAQAPRLTRRRPLGRAKPAARRQEQATVAEAVPQVTRAQRLPVGARNEVGTGNSFQHEQVRCARRV